MPQSSDHPFVHEVFRRQGLTLPSERLAALTHTAVKLSAASRTLEERLSMSADIFGFLTALRSSVPPSATPSSDVPGDKR
ncbi:MAG: hypothetical protein F8N37_15680 [Telmatospirillum sp.]|nr:hypothetical protein [Telmatospirillum sp.]